MRVVIGYESIYGNTRRIAEAIATGFGPDDDVRVQPVAALGADPAAADLLVIGVPTHAHGLPRPKTRSAAVESAHSSDRITVEPTATGTGVREWLTGLPGAFTGQVATFDTRFRPPAWVTGHPARRVAKSLERRGAQLVAAPESFFVDKNEELRPGEVDRAREWGTRLRRVAASTGSSPVRR